MPSNVSVDYTYAEKRYLAAKTDEEKLLALEEMLRTMPQHKSAEAMRANLRTRYKKLKEKLESKKQARKSGSRPGIRKEEMQACLIGLANSGKSSILASLTNAHPEISPIEYTTKQPVIGTLDYDNVKIQIIDMPAIESEYFDSGIANTSDTLIIVTTNPNEVEQISQFLEKFRGNKIIVLTKSDTLSEQEKRKFSAQLQSKKYNFILFSSKTQENIEELKEKLFKSFNKIRIYTKQPHHTPDSEPIIMPRESTVKDIAEKIFHGFSDNIRESRVTGPSSKFPNQKVGLNHILKDKDIIEFHQIR
jgi:ribosome-interacting GTPase 1